MVNLHRQRGFTFLIALFIVATLSIITLRALENSLTKDRRAKEEELLFVGQAFQQAIMNYYQNTPGGGSSQNSGSYPSDFDDLLDDKRSSTTHRWLRRIYIDPITASQNWKIVPGPNEKGIMGVCSTSLQTPIKVNGFPPMLSNFVNASSYQQWCFTYSPSVST